MKEQPTVDSLVFVVDDDASVRASLKSLLESIGLHVELFESADDFLKSKIPDIACCLVLDVRLPGLSGLEFQAELAKAGAKFPDNLFDRSRGHSNDCAGHESGSGRISDQALSRSGSASCGSHRARTRSSETQGSDAHRTIESSVGLPDSPREGGYGLRRSGTFEQTDCRGDGDHRGHCEDASRKHHAENAGAIAGGPGKDGRSSGHQPHEI